ncbi:MAG: glutamyl-tRNA reductase [Planctomycetota bacterium]
MNTVEDLVLIGLSQRTAPVAVRERCSIAPEEASEILRGIVRGDDVDEAVVVSTCNRTEAIAASVDGTRAIESMRATLFRDVDPEHLYTFRGVRAIMHLFRVASGLDSLVLGESEILGQVKRSFDSGSEADSVGPFLRPLFAQALGVGKRVRRETSIGDGSLSVARVGIDVAARAIGRFEDRTAAIVGAGETGLLAARHLLAHGVGRIALLNRTLERAREAALGLDSRVEAMGLDRMGSELARADVGVVCVDGAGSLVTADGLDRRALGRRDQPLVLLDLSVPRAVGPDVANLDGVLVYDLDDLMPIVESHRAGRAAAAEEAAPILVSEVHKYLSLRTFASFSPAIEELKSRFGEARDQLIDRVTKGQATPRELELANAMEKHFLGLALGQLKESARHSQSTAALDRAYRRFVEELASSED